VPDRAEFDPEPLTELLFVYYQLLKERVPHAQTAEQEAKLTKRLEAVSSVIDRIERFCAATLQGSLRYIEEAPGGVQLTYTPIDVSPYLAQLAERAEVVVYTSATLAVGKRLDFFARRVGLARYQAALCASSFHYPEQALIWVPTPQELPEPPARWEGEEAARYLASLTAVLERLIHASAGRAFLLFTSYRALEYCYTQLARKVGDTYLCLRQGELPRQELLRLFKEDGHAILFATKTFWQGVDVPGAALSLVVIDRLPFAAPSPLAQARLDAVQEAGGNWFRDLMLPEAIIELKQGLGRLIRTRTDRGAMAILDSRLRTKSYGRLILESLPPARWAQHFEEVAQFFSR